MIKHLIVFLSILILTENILYGQPPSTAPGLNTSIIPPSPDAASLAKYGSLPVTEYTGKVNVDIPLFEIKLPKISIPIRLGYNYSGYRPSEEASNIGLGWDLQAGGVITRSIKGKVDELVDKKWVDLPNVLLYDGNQDVLGSIAEDQAPAITWDTEPDIFHFNFNGYSGSFIMVKNKPVIFPHQNLQIERVLDDIIITTPDGTRYEFRDKEITDMQGEKPPDYVSAWNLTYIRSYDLSEFVHIKYTGWQHNQGGGRSLSETYFKRTGIYAGIYGNGFNSGADNRTSTNNPGGSILAKRIDEIITRTCRVVFVPETAVREDLNSYDAYAYKEINIYSKPDNALIKKIKFNHGYFNDVPNSILKSQLKLSSVEIWGQNKSNNSTTVESSNPQVYSFEYHNEVNGIFPRWTKGVDYWGYYNGANNNTLFNSTMLAVTYVPKDGNAVRDVDTTRSKNGILTKMTYPTKGYSTFEYEVNRVEPPGSPQIGYINLTETTVCNYNTNNNPNPTICNSEGGEFFIEPVNGNGTQTIQVEVTRDLPASPDPSTVKNFVTLLDIYAVPDMTNPVYSFAKLMIGQTHRIESVTLPSGTYNYKVRSENNAIRTTGVIHHVKQDPNAPAIDGPGFRIKTINAYDNINSTTPALVKRYEYTAPAKTNMNGWGCQLVNTVDHSDCLNNCKYNATELIYTSNVGTTVEPQNTESFYYPQVTEITSSVATNGKKVSKYANPNYTVAGVQLTEQAMYRNDNSMISKSVNTHQVAGAGGSYWGAAVNLNWVWYPVDPSCGNILNPPSQCNGHSPIDLNPDRMKMYSLEPKLYTTYYNLLTTTKEYTYGNNGGELLTQKDYFYDNPNHTMPTKTVQKNGKGEEITTLLKYPFDYLLSNCGTPESNYNDFAAQRNTLLQTTYTDMQNRYNWALGLVNHNVPNNNNIALNNYLNDPARQYENMAITNYVPVLNTLSNFYSNLKPCVFNVAVTQQGLSPLERAILIMQGNNIINPTIEQQSFIKKGTTDYLQNAVKYGFEFGGAAGNGNVNPTVLSYTPVTPASVLKTSFLANPSNYYQPKVNFKYNSWGSIVNQSLQDDIKTAYVYDYSELYPTAQVTNADNFDVAYTSFETDLTTTGNWQITGGISNTGGFIGNKSFMFTLTESQPATVAKPDLLSNKNYIVSYWQNGSGAITVKSNSTVINPVASASFTRNGWTYYEYNLPATTNTVSISAASAIIDELRLYPANGMMTNYCYDPQIGQTATVSPNNDVQFYEYDASGRLVVIRDQNKNVLKRICYNFSGQQEDCPLPVGGGCTNVTPNWQNTATATTCELNSFGVNTGNVLQEQRDMNPCSATYNGLQWVSTGQNTTQCPVPAYVNLTSTNTYGSTGFTATYTPGGGGAAYSFPVSATTGLQPLGTVPAGTYTLTITRNGTPLTCLFKSGCFKQMMTGTYASFSGVGVSSTTCNSITITPEN
jgi:YD repeat-containing protein